MRCENCLPLVEDYFDGELDERTTEQVAEHMTACATCASAYQKLEREQKLYLGYGCDVQAAPAFWDNVMAQAAIEDGGNSSNLSQRLRSWFAGTHVNFSAQRFSLTLTALIVLAAIGITIAVMAYINQRDRRADTVEISRKEIPRANVPQPTPEIVVAQTKSTEAADTDDKERKNGLKQQKLVQNVSGRKENTALLARRRENIARNSLKFDASPRESTPDQLIREAEQKYLAAIAMLSRDASSRRSKLDEDTAMRFERTLAAIDRTITDTRRAVREHPGDPVAAQYMLAAYAKKVDVLREMIGY